ncbi:T4 family baseplate hub assembly chaperone [Gimesia algae]|uniref:T4 bacteriophage base plate protein n=1 Tax=Gimesia algae TaxID=2527971 RepID=A0A517VBU2_9PLAN|nr:hypothetical protein [Gimesia algae]QDT90449.1 T4 bacteriophage base plate protein [Gimesia algae]
MNQTITNETIINLCERVADMPPARRAHYLLAGLSGSIEGIGELTVGERDRRLLLIRNRLFGDRVDGITECPGCGERVELSFSITNIIGEATSSSPASLHADGYEIHWRLPTSRDLAELAEETLPSRIRDQLIERCLQNVLHQQQQIKPLECPENIIQKVCKAMATADPFSETCLGSECPVCGHEWEAAFDIGTYLWHELEVWTRRLLGEVHRLASAYGWYERDILAMTANRRKIYLDMVEV